MYATVEEILLGRNGICEKTESQREGLMEGQVVKFKIQDSKLNRDA